MKNKFHLVYLSTLAFILLGCEKDDIKKREAEAFASFGDKLNFQDAKFDELNNGTILIRFSYLVPDSDIDLEVSFWNIEPAEGITNLVYHKVGGGLAIDKPTSYINVIVDGDGLGESYFTDSTNLMQSTLNIDCITKNKVTGSFQVFYEIEDTSRTKFAPWVPDNFSLEQGIFDARK